MTEQSRVGQGNAEYSVYWWSAQGDQFEESRYILLELAMHQCKRLAYGPAAALGMVKRVIITDGGDHIVFEWKYGKGITWPKLEQSRVNQSKGDDNA